MWLLNSARKLSPFLISFAVTCTFYINLCAWIFQCGCHSLWAGAADACNVHALHGRHCPWCSHGNTGYAITMILICLPQLWVSLRAPWNWTMRTLVGIALFPAVALFVAFAFGWFDGYWNP